MQVRFFIPFHIFFICSNVVLLCCFKCWQAKAFLTWNLKTTYPINNLAEVNCNTCISDVRVLAGGMYEDRNLLGADLGCSVAKHKQHRVYHIAFATAIGAYYCCETLKINFNKT